ncbi:MAG: hypothetical protein IJI68_11760 [Eggerthellaceae bacterium]|nr:hypothetical protein [Eggerthellaceae bacterium]
MNGSVQELVDATDSASQSFSQNALPLLSNGAFELGKALSGMSSAIAQFEPQIVELQGVLNNTDSALVEADNAIGQSKQLLSNVDADLKSTVADLGALGNALRVDEITRLLDIEPDNMGTFISSPVEMVTEKIYPVSNYGTAVAPFYTCLALWIGCFILLSVIKLEVDRTGFEEATTTQRYFGRLALLLLLALLQSQVICGVDILLGIDCAHPVAFLAAGAVCSFVFMNLLYALVITFRNIGNAENRQRRFDGYTFRARHFHVAPEYLLGREHRRQTRRLWVHPRCTFNLAAGLDFPGIRESHHRRGDAPSRPRDHGRRRRRPRAVVYDVCRQSR